jgi:hypothetical protein
MPLSIERSAPIDVTKTNPIQRLFSVGDKDTIGSFTIAFDNTNPFPHIELVIQTGLGLGFIDLGSIVIESFMLDLDLGIMFDQDLNPMYSEPYP